VADPILIPRGALGSSAPFENSVGAVTLREVTGLALASLAARAGQAEAVVAALAPLAGPLPGPAEFVAAETVGAAWTGPEQWMLFAPEAAQPDLARTVKAAVGAAGSVTRQSDGWVTFDLEGEAAPAVMERLCALDLGSRGAGFAARSVIEHVGVLVLCRAAARSFRILGPRSSARSLLHRLETAAVSVAAR